MVLMVGGLSGEVAREGGGSSKGKERETGVGGERGAWRPQISAKVPLLVKTGTVDWLFLLRCLLLFVWFSGKLFGFICYFTRAPAAVVAHCYCSLLLLLATARCCCWLAAVAGVSLAIFCCWLPAVACAAIASPLLLLTVLLGSYSTPATTPAASITTATTPATPPLHHEADTRRGRRAV